MIYFPPNHPREFRLTNRLSAQDKCRLSRRQWLGFGMASGMFALNPAFAQLLPTSQIAGNDAAASTLRALDALVDTLIPADRLTPSASVLGVSYLLLKQAETDSAFRPWLTEGLKWLDQGTLGSFALLDEPARITLVERLANAVTGEQTRTFFELIRLRTMTAYYADPRSRAGLAIERPPQPIGYPDFAGRA